MAQALLDPEESQVESLEAQAKKGTAKQLVWQGQRTHALPSEDFADVALDECFTGPASYGPSELYFSQFENLDTRGLQLGAYAPEPVRKHVVYVIVARTLDYVDAFNIGRHAFGVAIEQAMVAGVLDPLAPLPVETAPERSVPSLASVTKEMRDLVDLPVQDLARMCGLGRRQYYNLMRGESGATKTPRAEQHIRQMRDYLGELNARLSGDASQVRSALLLPLDESSRQSFYDIASSGDGSEVESGYQTLQAMLEGVGRLPKVLPPGGTKLSEAEWQQAADFMRADQRGR